MPIKPDEALKKVGEAKHIPKAVFDAFDELIVENLRGRTARVMQKEALERALAKMREEDPAIKREDFFSRGWLDVEEAYRQAGWTVDYDKPGYCETHEASFIFTTPRYRVKD